MILTLRYAPDFPAALLTAMLNAAPFAALELALNVDLSAETTAALEQWALSASLAGGEAAFYAAHTLKRLEARGLAPRWRQSALRHHLLVAPETACTRSAAVCLLSAVLADAALPVPVLGHMARLWGQHSFARLAIALHPSQHPSAWRRATVTGVGLSAESLLELFRVGYVWAHPGFRQWLKTAAAPAIEPALLAWIKERRLLGDTIGLDHGLAILFARAPGLAARITAVTKAATLERYAAIATFGAVASVAPELVRLAQVALGLAA